MAKLKLQASPTFKAKVGIPVPGGKADDIEFTFKHRTRSELLAWLEQTKDQPDADSVMDIALAWDLDDKFDAENVALLCDSYTGAGFAIVHAYLEELRGARAKN